jgi:hypothetical protein
VDLVGGLKTYPNWNFEDAEDGEKVPFEDAGFTIR